MCVCVCVCVCVLSSQELWPIIATERKKGRGANLYAYKISVHILSLSPENVTINPVIICHKLRYSNLKLENLHCILCALRSFPANESCMFVLNVGHILQGRTVPHPRRQYSYRYRHEDFKFLSSGSCLFI